MSHFLKGLSAERFNQKYPVGSSFNYFPNRGIPDSVEVVTRTEAWALHGSVVVSVNGRAGGLHIEHMKPIVLADSLQQNLGELKKAALAANLYGWTGFEDALNADSYSEAVSKFIEHCSPSVILELIANQEAAQKELGDLHNQEFQQRLANAEHQLYMKDLAIHNLKASRKTQFRKRLAAEAALSAASEKLKGYQVPVGLIEAGLPSVNDGEFVYVVRSKQFIPYGTSLFTAPQKPVVLPERYSFEVCATPDPNGEWVAVDEIIEAIKAAGGKVEGA